jgi:hypothetical protein
MIEQDPQIKPVQTEIKIPVKRIQIPDVDEIIDRRADSEMVGYRPWEDPEDLDTYLDQYQNDYQPY